MSNTASGNPKDFRRADLVTNCATTDKIENDRNNHERIWMRGAKLVSPIARNSVRYLIDILEHHIDIIYNVSPNLNYPSASTYITRNSGMGCALVLVLFALREGIKTARLGSGCYNM